MVLNVCPCRIMRTRRKILINRKIPASSETRKGGKSTNFYRKNFVITYRARENRIEIWRKGMMQIVEAHMRLNDNLRQ